MDGPHLPASWFSRAGLFDLPPLLSIDAVRSAGRRLPEQFRLRVVHDGAQKEICCTQVLRILPFKRLVCATEWDDKPAIAEIFLQRWRARTLCRRERRGLEALAQAGIPSPRVLAISVSGHQPILLLERITPAMGFGALFARCADEPSRFALLKQAVGLIARQHEAGLVQHDLHWGNLLARDEVLYAIDGSTMRLTPGRKPVPLPAGLQNLGLFLAQLPPSTEGLAPALGEAYTVARGSNFSREIAERLSRLMQTCRARCLRTILRKTMRECTQFVRFVDDRLTIVCRRDHDTPEMRRVLSRPDEAIRQGVSLKNGKSATAALVRVGSHAVVIKRYNVNLSRFRGFLRLLMRPSRARRSWYNANLLQALRIPTATPIAIMERHYGPFPTTAYLVTAFLSGERGDRLFRRTDLTDQDAQAIAGATAALVGRLYDAGLSHGDLNARNFVYQGTDPALLDLDAARRHRWSAVLRRLHVRDCRRLLRNFAIETPLHRELSRRVSHRLRTLDGKS